MWAGSWVSAYRKTVLILIYPVHGQLSDGFCIIGPEYLLYYWKLWFSSKARMSVNHTSQTCNINKGLYRYDKHLVKISEYLSFETVAKTETRWSKNCQDPVFYPNFRVCNKSKLARLTDT